MTAENIERVREFYQIAEGEHQEFVRRATKNLNNFHGEDLYTPYDISLASIQKRPLIHIPLMKPMIKLVMGVQQERPVECTVAAFEGGDELVAEQIFTPLLKYCLDRQDQELVNAMVYASGLITRRGFWAMDWDYSYPYRVNGRMILREEDPRNIMLDPVNKHYDQKDAQFILRNRAMNKHQIAMYFGKDKAKLITKDWFTSYFPDGIIRQHNNEDLVQYLVTEAQWKKYTTVSTLLDLELDKEYEIKNGRVQVEGFGEQKISELIGYYPDRFKRSTYVKPQIMQTTICGETELAHGEMKFNDNLHCATQFSIIPYMPNFTLGKNSCFADDLKDLQRMENMSNGMVLHMLNSAANLGWVYREGAVTDPKKLETEGANPNFILEIARDAIYGQDVRRLDSANIPPVDRMVNARDKAKEATLLNTEFLSVGGEKGLSGRAINLKQQSAMTSIATETVPHMWSLKLVCKYALGMIQSKMTVDQAMKIINYNEIISKEEQEQIAQQRAMQQVKQYEQESGQELADQDRMMMLQQVYKPLEPKEVQDMVGRMIGEKLEDYDVLQYDIVAEVKPRSPTVMEAQFEKLMDAYEKLGPQIIDPEVVVETMDVPKKQKLLSNIRQMKEAPKEAQA